MGHVFRSLMLAHEIANHKVFFVCTKESELAASNIAARDYKTVIQQGELWEDVLALDPDLVINDMLDTPREYMEHLKAANIPVVNFEDEGPGSVLADQVVNALYEEPQNETNGKQPERFLYGHKYFCLRDEFLQAEQNAFRPAPKCILITFGGTDMPDYTRQTLDTVEPLCRERGIAIRVVTGPGLRAPRRAGQAHQGPRQSAAPFRVRHQHHVPHDGRRGPRHLFRRAHRL